MSAEKVVFDVPVSFKGTVQVRLNPGEFATAEVAGFLAIARILAVVESDSSAEDRVFEDAQEAVGALHEPAASALARVWDEAELDEVASGTWQLEDKADV